MGRLPVFSLLLSVAMAMAFSPAQVAAADKLVQTYKPGQKWLIKSTTQMPTSKQEIEFEDVIGRVNGTSKATVERYFRLFDETEEGKAIKHELTKARVLYDGRSVRHLPTHECSSVKSKSLKAWPKDLWYDTLFQEPRGTTSTELRLKGDALAKFLDLSKVEGHVAFNYKGSGKFLISGIVSAPAQDGAPAYRAENIKGTAEFDVSGAHFKSVSLTADLLVGGKKIGGYSRTWAMEPVEGSYALSATPTGKGYVDSVTSNNPAIANLLEKRKLPPEAPLGAVAKDNKIQKGHLWYYVYPSKGMVIVTSKDNKKHVGMKFCQKGAVIPNMKAFKGAMPFGVTFKDDLKTVNGKLGRIGPDAVSKDLRAKIYQMKMNRVKLDYRFYFNKAGTEFTTLTVSLSE